MLSLLQPTIIMNKCSKILNLVMNNGTINNVIYTLVRRALQHNNQLERTETYSVNKYFYSI